MTAETRTRSGPIDLPPEFWDAPKGDQQAWRTIGRGMREAQNRLQYLDGLNLWERITVLQCYAILLNKNGPELNNSRVDNFLISQIPSILQQREQSEPEEKLSQQTEANFLIYCMNYAQGLYHQLHPRSGTCDPRITARFLQEITGAKIQSDVRA